jgi:hypothetical protein
MFTFATILMALLSLTVPPPPHSGAASRPDASLDRLQAAWTALDGYTVTIDAHEVSGDKTEDHELRYTFAKPGHARLDVVSGSAAGATVLWDGGDTVTAFRRGLSFFKLHVGLHDKRVTSLRGNGVLTPDLGVILGCYAAHRNAVSETDGPPVDGAETTELRLTYDGFQCPDDPPADRNVTLDVLDLSRSTGLVVERRRYEGDALVEKWDLKDYQIEAGAGESQGGAQAPVLPKPPIARAVSP